MIKLVFTLRRREDMTREEFQRYWREQHAPLVTRHADALHIRRYVQVHACDTDLDEAIAGPRGSESRFYDGVAELWWDSLEELVAGVLQRRGPGRWPGAARGRAALHRPAAVPALARRRERGDRRRLARRGGILA